MKSWNRIAAPVLGAFVLAAAGAGHAAGNGSGLAVALGKGPADCSAGTVDIDVAVTARAAAPLTLFLSTGGDFADLGAMPRWASYGPVKGAVRTVQVSIPNGVTTTITACVAAPNGESACASLTGGLLCDGGNGTDDI